MNGELLEAAKGWVTVAAGLVGVIMAIVVPVRGWRREERLYKLQASKEGAEGFATAGAAAAIAVQHEDDDDSLSPALAEAIERLSRSAETHGEAEAHRKLLDEISALRRAIEDLAAWIKRLLD